MTFANLQNRQRELSLRIRAYAGEAAFPESTVGIPVQDNDELSFIRLVVWCHVLVNETGRIAMRFLRELPPLSGAVNLPEASYLRTWATHNLLPGKESDRKQLQRSWGWFKAACGKDCPSTEEEWQLCFQRLVTVATELVQKALIACEALAGPDDGPRLLDELSRRVTRDWAAFRFDSIVMKVAIRLGFEGIDAVLFRNKHLDSWRKVVEVAEDESLEALVELRIEKDLLDLMNDALPFSTKDLLDKVPEWTPAQLGALMLALRGKGLSKDRATDLLASVIETLD